MQTWTAPINAAANPYAGGWLSPDDKAERIQELRLERADAVVMLAEATAAADGEAVAYWKSELARLTFALEG
jgi:tellurite resistance protein